MLRSSPHTPGVTSTWLFLRLRSDIASDYVHVTPEDGKEEGVATVTASAVASGASQGATTPGAGSGTSETRSSRSSSRPAAVAAATPATVVSSRPDAPSPDCSSFVHVKKPVTGNGGAAGTGGGDGSVSDGSAKGTDAVDDAEGAVVVVRADAEEVGPSVHPRRFGIGSIVPVSYCRRMLAEALTEECWHALGRCLECYESGYGAISCSSFEQRCHLMAELYMTMPTR